MSEIIDEGQRLLQVGSGLPPDRKFYFNGFIVGVAPPDCSITLLSHGEPIAFLSASHIVVKSMATALLKVMSDFEKKTGQEILTIDEISDLIKK